MTVKAYGTSLSHTAINTMQMTKKCKLLKKTTVGPADINPLDIFRGWGEDAEELVTFREAMPAFSEPQEAGRASGAVLLRLLAAPFDLSLPWGVLGGLPGCHVATTTSRTELDLQELFHTTAKTPVQLPEAAGAQALHTSKQHRFGGRDTDISIPSTPTPVGRQKRPGRRRRRDEGITSKQNKLGGLLLRKQWYL